MAEPSYDLVGPYRGPCAICGHSDDARHRVYDAVQDRVQAGDDEQAVAEDYGIAVDAVHQIVAEGADRG